MAMRLADTAAVSCVDVTKLVLNGVPFHVTTMPLAKPEPLTVSVKAGPPATAEFGDRLVRVICGGLILKINAFDVLLLNCAVTDADPARLIRFDGTVAVN